MPFERCPHITAVVGFCGATVFPAFLIFPLASIPPEFAQHLCTDLPTGIITIERGWIDRKAKMTYLQFCVEEPTCIMGTRPINIRCDVMHYTCAKQSVDIVASRVSFATCFLGLSI